MSSRKTKTKAEEEVEKIKEKIKSRAEQLVLEKFPKKIIEIKSLLRSELFQEDYEKHSFEINIPYPATQGNDSLQKGVLDEDFIDEQDQELSMTKPWLFPKGEVPTNRHIVEMCEVLKPLLIDMIKDLNAIRLGIKLMIPEIEAGHNFGVQVQENTLKSLNRMFNNMVDSYVQIRYYYGKRGDLVVKVAKYPDSDDFRKAIQEHDEKENIRLVRAMKNLHKHYTTAHDVVTKNLNKIKNPRSAS